ncbi:MAG: ATP-dependent Clp protease ATP-binding subunit [Candidatus Dojkabacteria bacterium]|nr:MAG: ATP-dependent Clp protease ATP-binding subunit [Candidatus Dojkabacteria bacterium]
MFDKQKNNTTLIGYHDKSSNRYSITEGNLPVLTDEKYAPFLITATHHYSISTKDIVKLINNYRAIHSFARLKNLVAQLLVLPGLVISALFLLQASGLVGENVVLDSILTNKITNITFWVAVLGVIILWHDYYRTRSHPIRIPAAKKMEEKLLANIRNTGIQFSKYTLFKMIYFLNDETQEMLVAHINKNGINTYKFFLDILEDSDVQNLIKRAGLELDKELLGKYNITSQTMPYYHLPALRSIITYALDEAILSESPNIRPEHMLLAYIKVFPVLHQYIQAENSSLTILRSVIRYEVVREEKIRSSNRLNINYPYYRTGGIAKSWVFGYTFVLNKFTRDLNQEISYDRDRYGIGHESELEELVSVLGRLSKNNALLIGEPGVGKSSLIKGVAQKINWGNVPHQLDRKRILQLDINSLIAMGSGSKLETLVQKAMSEIERAGNAILYIDEIQEIIPTRAEESGHSLAGILMPYILEGNFPVVGSINYSDYKKYFYSSESLRNSFENIEVKELTPEATLRILETKIDNLESNYGLYITFPALTAAIELSQRYVTNRKLPDSAVDTIETACSWAQTKGIKQLESDHVAQAVSVQTDIPVENITAEEATKLMTLEEELNDLVIGQEPAVHSVVEALKRSRTDIRDPHKPIGVFLFLGPTGTGKTHLSKILADKYFGTKSQMIKVDMSEYQEVSSINKILGSMNSDYGQTSTTLLDRVKSNPFSVVVFDEIEKANPQVLDLFLQLFDEGRLTSNNGETIDFTNSIIICTSNIGSRNLIVALERDKSLWEEAKQAALLELRGALRPELLNRFDSIVVFSPHDINNLVKITSLLLNQLAKRVGEKGITLEWSKTIPMLIANAAQEPGMGARPIKRFIQDKIETKLADEILEKGLKPGDVVDVKEGWLMG